MKKDIVLRDGSVATVTVLKMYANVYPYRTMGWKMDLPSGLTSSPYTYWVDSSAVITDTALRAEKFSVFENVFIESLKKEDFRFAKKPGYQPIGYVIRLEYNGCNAYGVSLKSYKDHWDNRTGLKVAYERLRNKATDFIADTDEIHLELFQEGKIAQLINLAKS